MRPKRGCMMSNRLGLFVTIILGCVNCIWQSKEIEVILLVDQSIRQERINADASRSTVMQSRTRSIKKKESDLEIAFVSEESSSSPTILTKIAKSLLFQSLEMIPSTRGNEIGQYAVPWVSRSNCFMSLLLCQPRGVSMSE